MERENKYRGKTRDGYWLMGSLFKKDVIIPEQTIAIADNEILSKIEAYIVDSHTVGQYIGRTDAKFDMIFEDDVVEAYNKVLEIKERYIVRWYGHGFFFMDAEDTPWTFEQLKDIFIVGYRFDDDDEGEWLPF